MNFSEPYFLPLFIFNIILILGAASLGYHLAPRLLANAGDDVAPRLVGATRSVFAISVALYMFFNCLGYFQRSDSYLLAVTALALVDIGLQLWMRRAKSGPSNDRDGE